MGGNFTDVPMIRLSYNDVHNSIQKAALRIKEEFEPTLFIAIGGGGFIPARILRTFLKTSADGGKKKNIPIQAVGLTLYEDMGGIEEVVGKEVIRTQWLDFSTLGKSYEHGGLLGRRVLIVDEVDDTRTTLMYLISELRKDIDEQLALIEDVEKREQLRRDTQLGIFVVHNKLKPKAGELPADVKYYAAQETPDVWLAYPWECETSIEQHDADRVKNVAPEA